MRAVVCHEWGDPDVLVVQEWPDPQPQAGHVLIRVEAFGLNRAEMFTRQGHSPGVATPRVIGIECVGVVEAADDLAPGTRVAALMGGMGRAFDGSYAEKTSVPRRCVFPLETDLDAATLGALPEMLQTCLGSLRTGLHLQDGETLLIRGGTSSIGLTCAALAKRRGCTVLSTTRNPAKAQKLVDLGVDHVVIDDGRIEPAVRALVPEGVDKVLELVGTVTLLDSLRCARTGGKVCMTGILGNSWELERFQPMGDIPHGVFLTHYSGGPEDIALDELQQAIDDVAAGRLQVRVHRVFDGLDAIVEAHRVMEGNRATGKLVVRL